jgi:hypothetical protein
LFQRRFNENAPSQLFVYDWSGRFGRSLGSAFGISMMLTGVGKAPGGGGGGGSLTSNPARQRAMTAIAQRRSWRHNF